MKKYLHYTIEEFVADEFFQKWIKDNDPETDKIWLGWLKENFHKSEEVTEAKEIILSFYNEDEAVYDTKAEMELKRLFAKIEKEEEAVQKAGFRGFSPIKYGIAAVVIFSLITTGLFIFIGNNINDRFSTGFGETKEITLPDGSMVLLNAKTTIEFNPDWEKHPREVWIEGEAFFQVKKIKEFNGNKKFVVHSRDVSVEVLGTIFNVNSRKEKTTVLLKEGAVNLVYNGAKDSVLMIPGELVEISDHGKLVKQKVKAEIFTAWKDNVLIFEQSPLKEIARILEENYGYHVIFDDPAIKERLFTGSIKTDEINILLTKISKSNDLKITTRKKIVTISNP